VPISQREAPNADCAEVRLDPLGEQHLDGLAALVGDPAVQRFTRVPVPPPPDMPRRWLARYEQGRLDRSCEGFAIVDPETAAFLGLALAPAIDHEGRTAELGYVVAPGARGRGVATAALSRLTEWGLSELGALRLELVIDVANAASKRVAGRCGYEREGVLRSVHVKQGLRADVEMWSHLADDRPHTPQSPIRR
jgi:RimJ/RimL family protein N-acetyltransferase